MRNYVNEEGSGVGYSSPELAFEGIETIPVIFPTQVNLTLLDGELVIGGKAIVHRQILFKAGINEVPEKLLSHWWLKANGVLPYIAPKPSPAISIARPAAPVVVIAPAVIREQAARTQEKPAPIKQANTGPEAA
jgi:hypothetical protein